MSRLYTDRLEAQGIRTLVPDEETCVEFDQIMFNKLTQGVFSDASRERYVEIMNDLKARGADAVALSCTEIGLFCSASDRSPAGHRLGQYPCGCDCRVDDGARARTRSTVTMRSGRTKQPRSLCNTAMGQSRWREHLLEPTQPVNLYGRHKLTDRDRAFHQTTTSAQGTLACLENFLRQQHP